MNKKGELINSPSIHPNEITRSLNKSIDWNIGLVQILKYWPPRSVQIIDVIFVTLCMNPTPIGIGHSKPLTVTWPNVDVDGTEVVILLMPRCPTTRHLHIQLHRIHAQNHMTNMRQHIGSTHDPCKGR